MSDNPPNPHFARIAPEFTPFAAPSHEPRFAMEVPFTDVETIDHALRCAEIAAAHAPKTWLGLTDDQGQWLAVCGTGSFAARFPNLSTVVAFEGLDRREAALAIRKWLEEMANYGEPPWFDGGESRGIRIFHVGYGREPKRFYGWTVIQPHWFEVHK